LAGGVVYTAAAKFNGGKTKRVYRNPSLLITGKTALSILVKQ
jgi:hypothetical protein